MNNTNPTTLSEAYQLVCNGVVTCNDNTPCTKCNMFASPKTLSEAYKLVNELTREKNL